jgi:predicted nucleotidyltransferase component of viral defense system
MALTRRDVLEHQQAVPWTTQRQVEQELVLCQSMIAQFEDDFLKTQIAMRGGTLLHKVHLSPASRYSEDIDLVIVGDRPEDHISLAIRRVLFQTQGKPTRSKWEELKLAVRNAVKPNKELRKLITSNQLLIQLVRHLRS